MTDAIIPFYDNGAVVWYIDRDGKKRSRVLTLMDPSVFLDFSGDLIRLRTNGLEPFLVHSDTGPAIIRDPASVGPFEDQQVWVKDGKIHRADGPAVTTHDGTGEYYLHGFPFSKEEWGEISTKLDHKYTKNGILKFYKKGTKIIHRDGGPAIYCRRPDKRYHSWYQNGVIHRDNDYPAHVSFGPDGEITHYWFNRGRLHRRSGPAELNMKTGARSYSLNNERMTQEEFLRKVGALTDQVKLKDNRGVGASSAAWKDYLDNLEAGLHNRIDIVEANKVDRYNILLAKLYAARTPTTVSVIIDKMNYLYESEFTYHLSEQKSKDFTDGQSETYREMWGDIAKYKGSGREEFVKWKIDALWRHLVKIDCEESVLEEIREISISRNDAELLFGADEHTEVTTPPPPAIQSEPDSLSFGAVAGLCLAIAGAVGILGKSKSEGNKVKDVQVKIAEVAHANI